MRKITLLLFLISSIIFAQINVDGMDPFSNFQDLPSDTGVEKYGSDESGNRQAYSVYYEFYKQKSYDAAIGTWLHIFYNAPKLSKNIYVHGVTMYKYFIKNETDNTKKEALIDNLLSIYDQRILFFPGEDANILGRKGADLYKYRKLDISAVEEAYFMLKESFEIQEERSSASVINYYFNSSVKLYNKKIILNNEQLIDLYSELSTVIDYKEAQLSQQIFDLNQKEQLSTKEKKILKISKNDTKTLNNVRINMEKALAPHVTCTNLEALYELNFEAKNEDLSWLERAAKLLKKGDCADTEIYFKIAAKLHESRPTAKSAFYMGYLSLKQEDYNKAIDYFSQAVEQESDGIKKADYLFYLAKTYYRKGANASSKKYAIEATQYRSGWGAPFILVGDLYAQSSRKCGENTGNSTNDEFTKRVGYWAAIEKYNYAKKVDTSCAEEANKKIKQYTAQAPDKTSTFQVIGLDEPTYRIECWYVEVVKNPHFSQ